MILPACTHIHHFLENSALRLPDKVALIHDETRATYAQINNAANCLANWLINNNVLPGDRVVLLLENSLEYAVGYYGILKSGAVAVPLSTDIKPDALNYFLSEIEPAVIISAKRFVRLFKAADSIILQKSKILIKNYSAILKSSGLNSSSIDVLDFDELISQDLKDNPEIKIFENALASIIYTSGSTGKPKGVMLSHKNIATNTASICQYLQLTEKEIQMVVLPFFYVMGKSLLNTHFAVGGTVVLNNKFAFPATVINQMIEEKITGFSGVPSTYAYLLHRSPLAKKRDQLQSLRYCSQAGGHMALAVKKALRRALPDKTDIYIMYGATEVAARLTFLEPNRFAEKIDSIGKPIPGSKVKLLDKKGQDVEPGQKGEIIASGDNIMQGYWKDKIATAKVLDDKGYHTGDLAYQDPEGFLYIKGRKDSLIKVSGHRINPQEIEDIMLATGLFIEVAVLGLPDNLSGNKLVAVIVPENGDCTEKRVFEACAKKLPKYKMPAEIKMIRALPKNASGKIDRSRCIELL